MPDIPTTGRLALAFIIGLFGLWMIVYMATSAFYTAQTKTRRAQNYRIHDFNLNFPPGLALLLKEWIEQYRDMADAKANIKRNMAAADVKGMVTVCADCHRPVRKVAGSSYVGRCPKHHNLVLEQVVYLPQDRVNFKEVEA